MNYALTPQAIADLESIADYTYASWGMAQAQRYTDELLSALNQLASMPQLGKPADIFLRGARQLYVRKHVVFYLIKEQEIRILRILHERQLPANTALL